MITASKIINPIVYIGDKRYRWVDPFSLTPELAAVNDFAKSNEYVLPTDLTMLNQLIIDLKNAGVWQKLDLLYVFAGDGSTGYKLINLINPETFYPTAAGGFTWGNNGLKGNGSNAYLTTGVNPNVDHANYTLNNASRGGVITETGSINFDGVAGVYRNDFNGSTVRLNGGGGGGSLSYSGDGLVAFSRNDGTTMEYTFKGTNSSISLGTDATGSAHNQVIFRRFNSYGSIRLGCYFMGGYLTSTERQTFRTIFNNYLTAIGETPIA